MIVLRIVAVSPIIATIACPGHPAAVAEDAGTSAPPLAASLSAVELAPASPGVIAPAPCTAITHGRGLELLSEGMQDLDMGVLDAWPSLRVWLLGAELPGEPTAPRPAIDDALRARGAELYDRHCSICHGGRGDGKGPLAVILVDRPPRDFTTGVYKLRTTPRGSPPTDVDLFRTISRGLHGTPMIPWTNLSERDRWALVSRLKTFASDFADEPAPTPIAVPPPPAATPALIGRGQHLFQTAGCASCHGASGKGNGPGAALLHDAAGRQVYPRDLTGYLYRRGALMRDIYITVRTGFDGTPMASFANSLSPKDTWAVAAYVHSIAPRYIVTAGGVACPEIAGVDAWEQEGVRMAMITMIPTGWMMQPHERSDSAADD